MCRTISRGVRKSLFRDVLNVKYNNISAKVLAKFLHAEMEWKARNKSSDENWLVQEMKWGMGNMLDADIMFTLWGGFLQHHS